MADAGANVNVGAGGSSRRLAGSFPAGARAEAHSENLYSLAAHLFVWHKVVGAAASSLLVGYVTRAFVPECLGGGTIAPSHYLVLEERSTFTVIS